jgi:beta-glucosidase-like glycosyl hydrolase
MSGDQPQTLGEFVKEVLPIRLHPATLAIDFTSWNAAALQALFPQDPAAMALAKDIAVRISEQAERRLAEELFGREAIDPATGRATRGPRSGRLP